MKLLTHELCRYSVYLDYKYRRMIVEFNERLVIDGNRRKLHYKSVELDFPEGYTCFGKRDNDRLCGIGKQPDTVGVLWLVVIEFEHEDGAISLFDRWGVTTPKAMMIDVNGKRCWFNTDEISVSAEESIFWKDYRGTLSKYQYVMALGKSGLLFTYMIPSEYEDNGLFDQEHPLMMDIMGSVKEVAV